MPTGACGINCNICRLRLMGICSSCGSGKSLEAEKKLQAQRKIFGATCTILECACMNKLEYCLRDCDLFPCENFHQGPYPFSQGFLNMQKRRRGQRPIALTPNSIQVEIPMEYWDELAKKDIQTLCNLTLSEPYPPDSSGNYEGLIFRFLQEDLLMDIRNRCLKRMDADNKWKETDDLLVELVTLIYLNSVKTLNPLGKDIVSHKDLKQGHFFKGPHVLKTIPLLERYGNDMEGFRTAAERLNGKPVDMADCAYMLLPYSRIPLYYLFWQGDEEFKPKISILFDRSIEIYFEADTIWGLVTRVSDALLMVYDVNL